MYYIVYLYGTYGIETSIISIIIHVFIQAQ